MFTLILGLGAIPSQRASQGLFNPKKIAAGERMISPAAIIGNAPYLA
jgi:hypothetical protein